VHLERKKGKGGKKGKKKKSKAEEREGNKAQRPEAEIEADEPDEASVSSSGGAAGEDQSIAEQKTVECAICFHHLAEGTMEGEGQEEEKAMGLDCGHVFHRGCVEMWVDRCCLKVIEASCPMCRAAIMY
jgi:hypothetical protein